MNMKNKQLNIATCQFSVGDSIGKNAGHIKRYMKNAAKSGADIVHFSECALSGYVGTDFPNFEGYNWQLLKDETETIMSLAKELGIWVVLGSTHRLTEPNKPHNCLYLIDPEGKIADRYDKRFGTLGDLRRLTSGDHFVYFTVNGVKCSLLICFDLRFPELYRQLYKEGVNCIFQSFYNARQKGPSIHTHIMRQTMQCRAATNHFWISGANSSGCYSPYPSFFIQPDGKIVKQLRQNKADIMVNTVNLHKKFYDPMVGFREMAINGKFDNTKEKINDPRSQKRNVL